MLQLGRRDERGATLVIVGVVLTVLMIMAALTVDIGALWAERRQDVTAADSGALGAAKVLADGGSRSAAASEIIRLTYENTKSSNGSATLADWQNRWPACLDPDRDTSVYVATATSPVVTQCISFNATNTMVRVKLPTISIPSKFAGVIGIANLSSSAAAEAEYKIKRGGEYAIFGGSTNCNRTIDWSGSTTDVRGKVHTNNDLHVGGSGNVIHGETTYVNSVHAPPDKITFDPAVNNPVKIPEPLPYPVEFKLEDYQPGGSMAALAGPDYVNAGNSKIDLGWLVSNGYFNDSTKKLKKGLYYTNGDIDLSVSNMQAQQVTFVSANGVISMSGSNHHLTPWDPDGLVIFSNYWKSGPQSHIDNCVTPAVKMSGSTHAWEGIIFAPRAQIEMSGSTNTTFKGSLIGWTVKMNGSVLLVEANPDLGKGPPLIRLTK